MFTVLTLTGFRGVLNYRTTTNHGDNTAVTGGDSSPALVMVWGIYYETLGFSDK